MIWESMQKGAATGAWLLGFVCVLAVAALTVALIVGIIAYAYGALTEEEEAEEGQDDDGADETDAGDDDAGSARRDGASLRRHRAGSEKRIAVMGTNRRSL